jgi:pyruvate dehydrogenase E1 component alpha subunit
VSGLWGLPVVYVIENNRYGMGTSLDRASSVKDLYQRGSAYGMPHAEVDGMDVVAVQESLGEAVALARKEKRPTLIEAATYRFRGHSMSDPGKYRTREEVEEMMKRDPILRFARRILDLGLVTQEELDALDRAVQAEIEEVARFALTSAWPQPETIYEDVYVRSPHIHLASAEHDPAWRAATNDDRVPADYPASPSAKADA